MRHGWRDTVRTASDVAVLGYLMALAALPVVTAGAAVLTGSHAMRVYVREDRWPSAAVLRATFRRSFWPGLAMTAAGLALVVDVVAVRSGWAPGGVPLMVALIVLALAGAGAVGATLAGRPRRPRDVLAAAGVTGVVVVLALLVHPVLVPVLAGGWLFALHVGGLRSG
jgi:hypothetical protein